MFKLIAMEVLFLTDLISVISNGRKPSKELRTLFSRVLRDSTPRYVGPSVGWLVGWSVPFLLFWRF